MTTGGRSSGAIPEFVPTGVTQAGLLAVWNLSGQTGPQIPLTKTPLNTAMEDDGGSTCRSLTFSGGTTHGSGTSITMTYGQIRVGDGGTCSWSGYDFSGYDLYLAGTTNVVLNNVKFNNYMENASPPTTQGGLQTAYTYSGVLTATHVTFDLDPSELPSLCSPIECDLPLSLQLGAGSSITYSNLINGGNDLLDISCSSCSVTNNTFGNWGLWQGNHADAVTVEGQSNVDLSDNLVYVTQYPDRSYFTGCISDVTGTVAGDILTVTGFSSPTGQTLTNPTGVTGTTAPLDGALQVKIISGSGTNGTYTVNRSLLVPCQPMIGWGAVTDVYRIVPNSNTDVLNTSLIDTVTLNNNIMYGPLAGLGGGTIYGTAAAEVDNGQEWSSTSVSWTSGSSPVLTINSAVDHRYFSGGGPTMQSGGGYYVFAAGMTGQPQLYYTGPSSTFTGHFDSATSLTLDSTPVSTGTGGGFGMGQTLYGTNVTSTDSVTPQPVLLANTGGSGCPSAGCTYSFTGPSQTPGTTTAMYTNAFGLAGSTYDLDVPQGGSGTHVPASFGDVRNVTANNNVTTSGFLAPLEFCSGTLANTTNDIDAAEGLPMAECATP